LFFKKTVLAATFNVVENESKHYKLKSMKMIIDCVEKLDLKRTFYSSAFVVLPGAAFSLPPTHVFDLY
jgi:hypothetical protein